MTDVTDGTDVMDSTGAGALLGDERLTAIGLVVEVHCGLMNACGPDLEAAGFSQSAFEVLVRLARSPQHRLRMSELTSQCTITSSGLTRVVDRLQASGLVTREPCPTDRRGYYATLTTAGRAALLRVLPAHLSTIERTLTGVLSASELDAFVRTLRKVRTVVRPGSDPAFTAADV